MSNDPESDGKSTGQMWAEVIFSLVYLIVIWSMVLAMEIQQRRKASKVVSLECMPKSKEGESNETTDKRIADLFLMAFGLLAFGDSFHLGCRIAGNIQETLQGQEVTNIGYGDLFGAITITLFYHILLRIWWVQYRGDCEKSIGLIGWFLLLMTPVRFALMVPPQNDWGSLTPAQPWTAIRNIPLILQGLGVAALLLRDSISAKHRALQWIGILIVLSYACVIPVVFAGQRYEFLGLLMIPKTLCYIAMALVVYFRYFSRAKSIEIPVLRNISFKIPLEEKSAGNQTSTEPALPC